MNESIENESHLRGVIEQLQTRNRALEREARNGRAIIGSLKAAMREDSEHFFEQEKEIRSLQLALGEAAAERDKAQEVLQRVGMFCDWAGIAQEFPFNPARPDKPRDVLVSGRVAWMMRALDHARALCDELVRAAWEARQGHARRLYQMLDAMKGGR
jgi:hypothetical protein